MFDMDGRAIEVWDAQEMATEGVGDTTDRVAEIERWGVALASKQGELDLEIGEWLLAVREHAVHTKMGHSSIAEYAERRLGLSPHATLERIRVADSLTKLGEVRASLEGGELPWSAARELTRVVVPETEKEWMLAARGRSVREIEDMVAGRTRGQRPSDPADPRLRKFTLAFKVTGDQHAAWRELVRVKRRDVDPRLTEEEILMLVAREGLGAPDDAGKAPYQIALVQCEDCGRAWRHARGEAVEVTPEMAERAACDAQHIGKVDGAGGGGATSHVGRQRASQTIPPAVRRQVLARDGKCRVDGCRSAIHLDVHHIQLRSERGSHDPSNLILACEAHHHRLHDGTLIVRGDATKPEFFHADGTRYGERPDALAAGVAARVFGALRHMGWKEGEARRAIAEVQSHVGRGGEEEMLRAALAVLSAR